MTTSFKPEGYTSVSPYLIVDGAAGSIEFLKQVLGAKDDAVQRLGRLSTRSPQANTKPGDAAR